MKISPLHLILLFFYLFALTSFQHIHNDSVESVQIGQQIWMTNNLNTSTFRNGDQIFHAKSNEEWKNAAKQQQPAWRYMSDDSTLAESYGKLYNWYAVIDERGLAPENWRIPTEEDLKTLVNNIGKNAGHKMKSTSKHIKHGSGNNKSGFSGLLGGLCFFNGHFSNYRLSGSWWSTTEREEAQAWALQLSANSEEANISPILKTFGISVRCLKDL